MKNGSLEDTSPNQPEPEADAGSLEQTRPTPVAAGEQTQAVDPGATVPTPVSEPAQDGNATLSDLEQPPPGFEETIPPPVASPLPVASANQGAAPLEAAPQGLPPQPAPPPGAATAGQAAPKKPKKRSRLTWLLSAGLGLLILLLIAVISALGGYRSGISLRQSAEGTEAARTAEEQFNLGIQEMEQGQYFRARQRFEYVIQINPSYPGVTEKLAAVLMELNTTATPTTAPTPTLTPTPDLRSEQQLYDQGRQFLASGDWNNAIDALLSLRKISPGFQMVEVDGMLFLALRNRGVSKITSADLEGGIYDLTLAANFGPLDTEAQAYLTWSTMYITGASFWQIDWEQVIYYFEQVAPQMPALTDGSGMTANERLRIALYELGNMLAQGGRFCQAVSRYQQSLAIAYNPEVEAALNAAVKGCQQDQKPQQTPAPGGP
ncbi:MAG: hypothetical protein JXA78_04205 [Anaerolineales bacterium]|nr:hypothetical protein [Anaerolineales bacterium]